MGPTVHHQHHPHYHGGSGGLNTRMLIQILLLILLLNFLPSSSEPVCWLSGSYPYKRSEPVYMLSRAYPYEHKYATEKGVSFYVKSKKFADEYPAESMKRVALESRAERDYFRILSQNCRVEIHRRGMGFAGETLHCDMLDQFNVKDYDYYTKCIHTI